MSVDIGPGYDSKNSFLKLRSKSTEVPEDLSFINKFKLDSKYDGIQTNMWKEFSMLDKQLRPVNLCSGYPDFTPTKSIVHELEKCHSHLSEAQASLHQYTSPFGHPRLVKILAGLYGKLLNRTMDPFSEVLVTLGATNALFCAIMSNVGYGDEVIIIEPAFDCYKSLVHLAGGTTKSMPLRHSNPTDNSCYSWTLDYAELRSLFNDKTKAIILNTPNNPLGKVFTNEELMEIGDLCNEFNVLAISDEVYEWAVYDEDVEHVRIAGLRGMWNRTITVGSAGKTFGLTGYRLGWAYGPPHLIQNLQVASSNCTYTLDTMSQEVLARIFEVEITRIGTSESIFSKMTNDLKERRDFMIKIVSEAGMKPIIPQAGIFLIANWRSFESKMTGFTIESDESEDGNADCKFVKWLVHKKNLLGIPPSLFYSPSNKHIAEDYIRFCFFRKYETLEKASTILQSLQNVSEN